MLRSLDPDRYEVTLIGITRDGRWTSRCRQWRRHGAARWLFRTMDRSSLSCRADRAARWSSRTSGGMRELPAFDLFFPVLHGPNGEDGTVQGALELSDVAYVGSGVMGSAAAMDKDVAKRLMRDAGLPIVPFVAMSAASPITYDEAVRAVGSRGALRQAGQHGFIRRRVEGAHRRRVRNLLQAGLSLRPARY